MPPLPRLLADFAETAQTLYFPWSFMGHSMSFLPGTISRLLWAGDFSALLSWSRFQSAWFSNFWSWAGPQVRTAAEPRVVPLLEGRVRQGRIVPREVDADVSLGVGVGGTVLEVGPGSGQWVSLFSDRYLPEEDKQNTKMIGSGSGRRRVTRVYGVEPNSGVHDALRAKVIEAGLEDVYEIVPRGIEELAASGAVERESVDCIVTVLCLCSVPDPRQNMRELYSYLKPGGRWFVYEHVRFDAQRGWVMSAYQAFLNIFWPQLIGGCELRRSTAQWLREAGPWSEVDLAHPENEPRIFSLPHVIGVLTK